MKPDHPILQHRPDLLPPPPDRSPLNHAPRSNQIFNPSPLPLPTLDILRNPFPPIPPFHDPKIVSQQPYCLKRWHGSLPKVHCQHATVFAVIEQ